MNNVNWVVMDTQEALDVMPLFLSGIGESEVELRVYQELAPAWAELELDLQGFGSGVILLQHRAQRLKLILLVKLSQLMTGSGAELVLFSKEDDEESVTLDSKQICSLFMVPNPSSGSDEQLYLDALEALGVIAKRINLQAAFAGTNVPTGVWF
ncbi:hypothetical protein BLL42_27170 (plasmid) [Pseudomonas frederiksbergensis]|uniref:Uncharacterized protein n=1 Tax=Pseudomonas frederiksbergensis TaxID=104087 RepID=A0A1J0ETV0_9PSED|nr:hypothetical protein [Pseudomonas frederiksbergensis]APC19422.1 hypothetical protein BLL42_27170 [Pseudomonas frederiksbergensis]